MHWHGSFSSAARRLIVANHVSWLDIPVLGSLEPMTFLAKKEVAGCAIGRELVAVQGAVYVDRRRRFSIPAVNARMVERMCAGSVVVLFAEATTGDGNRLLRFRSPHFEAVRLASDLRRPALVQPIYLNYSSIAGLPTARWERPRIAWYGDMSFLPHFLSICPRRRRHLRCPLWPADPGSAAHEPEDGRAADPSGGAGACRESTAGKTAIFPMRENP